MKTLRPYDVKMINARDVKPGDVLLEGVVLDVDAEFDTMFFRTRLGLVSAPARDTVQVFARLASDDMLDACRLACDLGIMPLLPTGKEV